MSDRQPPGSIPPRLPRFDPQPSADFAWEILTEIGQPHALIGKVAMWMHQPPNAQEFTKDVDFAVPVSAREPLRAALQRRGMEVRELSIGGVAVRAGEIRVDFIDRQVGGLDGLYAEAISEARARGGTAAAGQGAVPVVTAEYLVALKLVTGEDKDERDAVKLIRQVPDLDLRQARAIVLQHGGPAGANRLDALARRAGHPEARPDYRNGGEDLC